MTPPLTLENLARWNGWITSEDEYQKRKAFYEEVERRMERAVSDRYEAMQRALGAVRDA